LRFIATAFDDNLSDTTLDKKNPSAKRGEGGGAMPTNLG